MSNGVGCKDDYYVHHLVAWPFLGPQPAAQVVRHLDGDPTNNHVSSLVYGSYWDNRIDVFRMKRNGIGILMGRRDIRELERLIDSCSDVDVLGFLVSIRDKIRNSIEQEA